MRILTQTCSNPLNTEGRVLEAELAAEAEHAILKLASLLDADGVPVGVDDLGEISSSTERTSRCAPQDGRTPGLRFRALLTENGVERVELART
jgi:EAL domain-containing protein (putative c-di-GMP-specific phosphodiesterase class I)